MDVNWLAVHVKAGVLLLVEKQLENSKINPFFLFSTSYREVQPEREAKLCEHHRFVE